MIIFEHPWVLFFLLLLPLFIYGIYRRYEDIKKNIFMIYTPDYLNRTYFSFLVRIKKIILSFMCVFLVLALSAPKIRNSQQVDDDTNRRVVIALDVSRSMYVESDKGHTRMNDALRVLRDMVEENNASYSVFTFTDYAVQMLPLIDDEEFLVEVLDSIAEGTSQRGSTNFKRAFTEINKFVLQFPPQYGDENINKPILVLVSDGESYGEKARDKLRIFEEQMGNILVIAVGSEELKVQDETGKYILNSDGSVAVSFPNPSLLKDMAAVVSAEFYHADEVSRPIVLAKKNVDLQDIAWFAWLLMAVMQFGYILTMLW